jgi:hypothetical protein
VLKWFSVLLKNLFGDGVARLLGGAGLTLVTGAVMLPMVTTALNTAAHSIGGIGGGLLDVVLLLGIGEAMSIIGSAMLTRLAMNSTRVGLKRAVK